MIQAAQAEAVRLGHAYIGSEHLLLGVAVCGNGGALSSFGVTPEGIRAGVVRIFGRGGELGEEARAMPFTPHAKSALERALQASVILGQKQIEPEHILIALVVEDGAAARILRECDVSPEEVRRRVVRALID